MNFRLSLALSALALAAVSQAQVSGVQFLGIQTFATGATYGGTTVGGLSGVDYDAASGTYYLQSDARTASTDGVGSFGRHYTATIPGLASGTFGAGSLQFTGVGDIRRPDGSAFPGLGLDPESIRYHNGKLWVSSEGDVDPASNRMDPFVRSYNLAGDHQSELPLPAKFKAADNTGIRDNLAFESLAFSPDGLSLYTATENALKQDGPASTFTTGSNSRILRYDLATGLPAQEYVYQVGTVAENSAAFSVNGLVELLAVDNHRMLALERSFSVGTNLGNSVKLFEIDLDGATDVSGKSSVADMTGITAVSKRLVFDFNAGTGLSSAQLDNLEGMTWGPTLADGSRTLVVVSDNNFNSAVGTQIIALKVQAVPEPMSMVALGIGAAAMMRRRRR